MKQSIFQLYEFALHLYPRSFRLRYHDELLQTALASRRDHAGNNCTFFSRLFADLLRSSIAERTRMLRHLLVHRPLVFLALLFAAAATLLGGIAAVTMQSVLRGGANEPQYDMVRQFSSELASGVKPDEAIPSGYVDAATSLEPFLIFYDEHGNPQTGTGYLGQQRPSPPAGVFNYARQHGMNTLTWQPQRDVRIAAVMKHVSGPTPGFLLAGRSLHSVEQGTSLLRRMTFIGWALLMAAIVLFVFIGERMQRHVTEA